MLNENLFLEIIISVTCPPSITDLLSPDIAKKLHLFDDPNICIYKIHPMDSREKGKKKISHEETSSCYFDHTIAAIFGHDPVMPHVQGSP